MRATVTFSIIILALVALPAPRRVDAGDKKPHECVRFASSWEAAVEEARLLNLPIVVHSHGFYCPPCWGMHTGLLQNDEYMAFADKATVEVIVLGSLEKGIKEDHPRAAEYEAKIDGKTKRCMVEFPGLSRDEMLALGRSAAARYNQTGAVPYTCVVDPHTGKELEAWRGATSKKTIIERLEAHAKALEKAHGKGLRRKDLRKYEEAEAEARAEVTDGDYARAIKTIDKATRKSKEWPEVLRERAGRAREEVVAAATKALEEAATIAESDPKEARRMLSRLRSKLRGTGLEDRLKQALTDLKARK